MRAGEPYVVIDAASDPRITAAERPSYEMTAIRAVICVPILKEGRFVAAMAVHTLSPRVWDADEVALVQRVASRCWESIERTRVTHALRESEHLFRALANSIANLAWMARPDGWIYWYNDQWYEYTGTTPADMEGWGWEQVHDPVTLPTVKERWQHSIATGTPFEMVFPLRARTARFEDFSHASTQYATRAGKWSIGSGPTRTLKASDERQRRMRNCASVSNWRGTRQSCRSGSSTRCSCRHRR